MPALRPHDPTETYNDGVIRQFTVMTVVWGIVGMLVGVIIAAQLYWPTLFEGIPWLSYGRLRPATYQLRGLRFRRIGADGHQLLNRAAHLPRA